MFVSQGPHSHILMMGGGGDQSDFLGSEIFWLKVIFFGSIKDAEIFLGCEKKQKDLFWLHKNV